MEIQVNIPQLLKYMGIEGYVPQLGVAINKMLEAKNTIEYNAALHDATAAVFYPGSFFPDLPKFMPLLLQRVPGTEDDLLLDNAIVIFAQRKNIVMTSVQGRDNTVKEFIADGDYNITVKGALAYKGMSWPRDEFNALRKFLQAKSSIQVVHEKLNAWGIYELVVTDYDFPESPYINLIPYSFNAVSEQPTELTIID